MGNVDIQVNSIFDGFMPTGHFGGEQEYLNAVGIDPDMPLTDASTDLKAAGAIRPVSYSAFSSTEVTSYPIAIITVPQNTNIYTVTKNGRLISYDSAFTNATSIGAVTGSNADGAAYYNNYIYIMGTGASKNDVSRYGPISNSPVITNGVWTGSTLGTLTALTNTTYPNSLLSTPYLNHYGVTHVDNNLYFLDYANGVGMVHAIKTTKTTYEGDTNDGSAYNVLDLPKNYLPISICSYGNNMVVSASYTTSSTILQGKAALFFFNPADDVPSFYQITQLPDAICSALWYENGVLYGISGDLNGGYRLFANDGGQSIQTIKYLEEGNPPLQGAIASMSNRLVWAADNTLPMVCSGLYAYGSKSGLVPMGLHHIALSPQT